METADNLKTALAFIAGVEAGETGDQLEKYYHEDVQHVEYPNAITKNLKESGLEDLKAASLRGQKVLQKQRYELVKSHVTGNTVILEVIWIGTLAISIGQLAVGDEMRAYMAQVSEFRDGKIFRQRNYDCFEPF